MNNEIRDYEESGNRVIGYRCFECQKIKPAMWGEVCNECRAKEQRHRELIDQASDSHYWRRFVSLFASEARAIEVLELAEKMK